MMIFKRVLVNTVNKKNAGLKERSTSERTFPREEEEAETQAELEERAPEGTGKCP